MKTGVKQGKASGLENSGEIMWSKHGIVSKSKRWLSFQTLSGFIDLIWSDDDPINLLLVILMGFFTSFLTATALGHPAWESQPVPCAWQMASLAAYVWLADVQAASLHNPYKKGLGLSPNASIECDSPALSTSLRTCDWPLWITFWALTAIWHDMNWIDMMTWHVGNFEL